MGIKKAIMGIHTEGFFSCGKLSCAGNGRTTPLNTFRFSSKLTSGKGIMKKPMSTTPLFDIVSEVRGTKLTKIAQIDRVIDWEPVRAVIETVYTKGSAPMGRQSYDGLMLFKIELLRVWYDLSD